MRRKTAALPPVADQMVDPRDVAHRMAAVKAKLEQRYVQLMESAGPELSAARTEAQAREILEKIVADLVAHLDAEEAALVDELLNQQPQPLKH